MPARGTLILPGDKSISQRVLIIGALMNQEMIVDGFLHGEDPLSTMNALNQIGAGITVDESGLIYLHKRKQIFDNCEQGSDFYFVHSFYFQNQKKEHSIATTKYPDQITAAVCKENICGTQFHPEKSHINGKKIIHNFLEWKP